MERSDTQKRRSAFGQCVHFQIPTSSVSIWGLPVRLPRRPSLTATAVRRLPVLSWDSTPETRRSRRKRWRATQVEPTGILGIWVLVLKRPLFCNLMNWPPCNYDNVPEGGDIDPKSVSAMIFNGLQHFERTLCNSGKCGWMNLIKLSPLSHFPLNAIEIRILLSVFLLPPTTCESVPDRFNTLPFYEWNSKIKRRLFYKLNASRNQAKRFYTMIPS